MRRVLAGLSFVVLGLPGCTRSDAATRPSDGELILEVGGDQSSLREALLVHGVAVAPARLLRPEGSAPVPAVEEPPREPQAERSPERPPTQVPPASPPGEDFVVVKLGRGQTLIHIAKKHLGDGNRFREILALNGWTEADARRLREDQPVKVPRPSGYVR